jgi:hypothetical protein
MDDYKVYAKVEDDIIVKFQGRIDSEPAEGEVEFPPNWGGNIGDNVVTDFKNGIRIIPELKTEVETEVKLESGVEPEIEETDTEVGTEVETGEDIEEPEAENDENDEIDGDEDFD